MRREISERIRKRLKVLRNDLYISLIIEKYPVVQDFLNNTRPFSVATFGGYIKLMRGSENVNEDLKKRFQELEEHYLDLLNEKLSQLGGVWVSLDEEGYTMMNYLSDSGIKQIKLSFTDVMNIYGGSNLEKIVSKIIEREEGTLYNIKYKPITSTV